MGAVTGGGFEAEMGHGWGGSNRGEIKGCKRMCGVWTLRLSRLSKRIQGTHQVNSRAGNHTIQVVAK